MVKIENSGGGGRKKLLLNIFNLKELSVKSGD
jgi:hypothetical protein